MIRIAHGILPVRARQVKKGESQRRAGPPAGFFPACTGLMKCISPFNFQREELARVFRCLGRRGGKAGARAVLPLPASIRTGGNGADDSPSVSSPDRLFRCPEAAFPVPVAELFRMSRIERSREGGHCPNSTGGISRPKPGAAVSGSGIQVGRIRAPAGKWP